MTLICWSILVSSRGLSLGRVFIDVGRLQGRFGSKRCFSDLRVKSSRTFLDQPLGSFTAHVAASGKEHPYETCSTTCFCRFCTPMIADDCHAQAGVRLKRRHSGSSAWSHPGVVGKKGPTCTRVARSGWLCPVSAHAPLVISSQIQATALLARHSSP